jgi:2-oxoglutarate dehydrogenase complex dehydrogenase (E1) component-like enzyme
MNFEHEFHGANLAYILELRERFEEDPNSVDESTRRFFEQWQEGDAGATSVAISNLQTVIATANLAQAIRAQGYFGSRPESVIQADGGAVSDVGISQFTARGFAQPSRRNCEPCKYRQSKQCL